MVYTTPNTHHHRNPAAVAHNKLKLAQLRQRQQQTTIRRAITNMDAHTLAELRSQLTRNCDNSVTN